MKWPRFIAILMVVCLAATMMGTRTPSHGATVMTLDRSSETLVRVQTFTKNYHDDWDNCCLCWDTQKHEFVTYLDGTTRFGGRAEGYKPPTWVQWTDEEKELARHKLVAAIHGKLKLEAERQILRPDSLPKSTRVQLVEQHRTQRREIEECRKCSGTGNWVNPRNEQDVRECFACKGTGQHRGREPVREDGKIVYDATPAGVEGEVIRTDCYRTVYRNGYNRPGHGTNTVTIRLDDGRVISLPQSKLRLAEPIPSEADLLAEADEQSRKYPWGVLIYR